jgi:hypothetical protein
MTRGARESFGRSHSLCRRELDWSTPHIQGAPTTDLRQQLQSVVGNTSTLERELRGRQDVPRLRCVEGPT